MHFFGKFFFSILMATGIGCVAIAEDAGGSSRDRMALRVQTHFSQGWNLKALDLVHAVKSPGIRDGIYWQQVELTPGEYDTRKFDPYFNAARDAGLDVLVVFAGFHPEYDGGKTPYTDSGRQAFARYVAAVVDKYPDVMNRIEIGNEYNTNGFLSGPFEESPGAHYGPLVKEVALAVKAVQPDTEILCTGAHSVATGYFRKVFESGALEHCDAISFHPYRDKPENVDVEIERLRALMREFGGEKPLYVTEFGDWFKDAADAPDFLLKMMSLLGASGVSETYWYALLEEEFWPNMGLFSQDFQKFVEQPAAVAFRFLQTTLLPLGKPVARGTRGEDRIYEFGSGGRAFVIWGAPGELRVNGDATYFNSSGKPIDPVTQISEQPVVILGEGITVSVSRDRSVYSAFLGYGSEPWSYFARSQGRDDRPFQVMDWNWNPYLGHPNLRPMSITSTKVASATFGREKVYAVERFTAPEGGLYEIEGRWFREKADPDGADIVISWNGEMLAHGVVAEEEFEWKSKPLKLNKGDQIDFAVGPNNGRSGNFAERVIIIQGP